MQTCRLVSEVGAAAPGLCLEFHGHNDLGMAAANTIAAFEAGAGAASVTVNGLGERAGNAALAEVVMALKLALRQEGGFKVKHLCRLSQLVSQASGHPLPDTKPVIGRAIFHHESGIHCEGLLRDQHTYEPFAPSEVGHAQSTMILGRHSGKGVLQHELKRLGLNVPSEAVPAMLAGVRTLACKHKRPLSDNELAALADWSGTGKAKYNASP